MSQGDVTYSFSGAAGEEDLIKNGNAGAAGGAKAKGRKKKNGASVLLEKGGVALMVNKLMHRAAPANAASKDIRIEDLKEDVLGIYIQLFNTTENFNFILHRNAPFCTPLRQLRSLKASSKRLCLTGQNAKN